jgi:hypothetical protein
MALQRRTHGGASPVIPRYQTVLFFLLLAASIVMGVVLWQLRARAHQRLLDGTESTPTQAPQVTPPEQATLIFANDTDGALMTTALSLPLPPSPNARARAILGKLLDLYAMPDAAHPVPGGAASVAQLFLLPATQGDSASTAPTAAVKDSPNGPQLAVVSFTAAFAASHPSGLETETLTIESVCATLHANLPRVTQVRFLIDGQPSATLAGHADLMRTYLTADAVPTEDRHP